MSSKDFSKAVVMLDNYMKILFLTHLLTERGGLQRVVAIVASQMAQKHSVDIGIIGRETEICYELNHKVVVKLFEQCIKKRNFWGIVRKLSRRMNLQLMPWLAKKVFYSTNQINNLEKYINDGDYDQVIAVGPDLPILLALVNRTHLKKKIKLFGWHHSTYEAYYHKKGRYAFCREKLAKKVLSNLDKIITLTKQDARVLKEKLGVNSTYIYNPLSFSSTVMSKLNTKNLLFVGRLDIKQKGVDLLLEIAALIFADSRAEGWKLIIVGDGRDREIIKDRILKMGLTERVMCLGSKKDIINYYLNADILLSTSRWEGFGMVITEAFECGLPVLSFINNGATEIIENDKNGYLIERFDIHSFAEKTIALMCDDIKRHCFANNAKKRALDFSQEKISQKWEEACRVD